MASNGHHADRILELLDRYASNDAGKSRSPKGRTVNAAAKALRRTDDARRPPERERERTRRRPS